MRLGEAADRCRIGDPPGAPRERGCPPWVVLGVNPWRRVARYMGRCTVVEQHHQVTRRPTLPFRAMSDSPLTPLK